MVYDIKDGKELIESISDRLVGRYLAEPLYHPETGELLVGTDKMMDDKDAKKIVDAGIEKVKIRSLLTCQSKHGVCIKCYGSNLATGEPCYNRRSRRNYRGSVDRRAWYAAYNAYVPHPEALRRRRILHRVSRESKNCSNHVSRSIWQ